MRSSSRPIDVHPEAASPASFPSPKKSPQPSRTAKKVPILVLGILSPNNDRSCPMVNTLLLCFSLPVIAHRSELSLSKMVGNVGHAARLGNTHPRARLAYDPARTHARTPCAAAARCTGHGVCRRVCVVCCGTTFLRPRCKRKSRE